MMYGSEIFYMGTTTIDVLWYEHEGNHSLLSLFEDHCTIVILTIVQSLFLIIDPPEFFINLQ